MLNLNQFGIDIRNFEKGEKIGKGGFSEVYLVQYKKSVQFAIDINYTAKVLKSRTFKEEEKINIENEINILSSINHPTIIKYLGYSLLDFDLIPNIVIFTEFAKNGSLNKIILQAKNSKPPQHYDNTSRQIILIGISCGMKYLHNKNIIHRDLKTNNILLDENYYPRITDFGMAKYVQKNKLFKPPSLCGTLPYMAPEVILGKGCSSKIDVYSFGILMYEVICESDLYPHIINEDSLTRQFKEYVAVSNNRPEFRKEIKNLLKKLIQKCWSSEPKDRPTFNEIFDKLIKPEYYLDNVDIEKVKLYIENITQNDFFPNSNSELIEKVNELSNENKSLREQIESLKNENQNLSRMMNEKTKDDSKVAIKPILANSPRIHHLDKNPPSRPINSQRNLVSPRSRLPHLASLPMHNPENEEKLKDDENAHKKLLTYESTRKLPSLNKAKKSQSNRNTFGMTIIEFNSKSLHLQLQIVKSRVISISPSKTDQDRLQHFKHLYSLLNYIIQLLNSPENGYNFFEIQPRNQEDEKFESVSELNSMALLSNATELLYEKRLLGTNEFYELVKIFDRLSIEIKYFSKVYHCIYQTACRMNQPKIQVFITGMKNTDNTFKGNKYIRSIRFDDSVSHISDYAFKDCFSLEKVFINSSINIIGSGSFEGCRCLESISIPSSVTSIGFSAFKGCTGLREINLGSSIKLLRNSTFYCCSSLIRISIPFSVFSIGDFAFFDCTALKEVDVPSSILSIGEYAFGQCSALVRISVPSSVNSIGKGAFKGCKCLDKTKLVFPPSIKNLDELF